MSKETAPRFRERKGKEMSEQMYSKKRARTNEYINRISATLVALLKLLEGVAAGFSLFHIIRLFAPAIGTLTKGTLDLNKMLQMVITEYGLPAGMLDEYQAEAIGGMALPLILWGGYLLVIVVGLLLVVTETIALLSLRFARTGAGVVKVIHQIYMVVCAIDLALLVYSIVELFRFSGGLLDPDEKAALNILCIIVGVISLIVLLLHFCYHKDISMAMRTVEYEVNTGKQGILRKTHLSGISFIFGLPYILIIISALMMLSEARNQGISMSQDFKMTLQQYLIMFGLPAVLFIKQLCICFCNRNLKRAR